MALPKNLVGDASASHTKGASSNQFSTSSSVRSTISFQTIDFQNSTRQKELTACPLVAADEEVLELRKHVTPAKLSEAPKSTSPNGDTNRPQITIPGQLRKPRTYDRAKHH
jgi:hypothetical protein